MSHWFGAANAVYTGPVCTLVAVSPAGATVAAEGHRVGKHGVGRGRAAGKDGGAVLHFVVGAASLDNVARTKKVPHVAVLLSTQKHDSCRETVRIFIKMTDFGLIGCT